MLGCFGCIRVYHWLLFLIGFLTNSYNIRACDEGNTLVLICCLISIGPFECCAETLQKLKGPSPNTVTPGKGLDGSRLEGPRPAFITRCM